MVHHPSPSLDHLHNTHNPGLPPDMSFGVGLGDLLTLPVLAWNVYKLCRDSSPQYQSIKGDVASMHAVIKETEELEGLKLKPEQQERLAMLKKNCQDVLLDLKKMVDGYESLGTQQQRTWDRMKWGLEPVTEIKQRLVSTTTALGALSSMLVKYDVLPSTDSRSPYIKLHGTVPHQLELKSNSTSSSPKYGTASVKVLSSPGPRSNPSKQKRHGKTYAGNSKISGSPKPPSARTKLSSRRGSKRRWQQV